MSQNHSPHCCQRTMDVAAVAALPEEPFLIIFPASGAGGGVGDVEEYASLREEDPCAAFWDAVDFPATPGVLVLGAGSTCMRLANRDDAARISCSAYDVCFSTTRRRCFS